MSRRANQSPNSDIGMRTGWPPGLLQDDSKGLSRWLASQPDARRVVREVCAEIEITESQAAGADSTMGRLE